MAKHKIDRPERNTESDKRTYILYVILRIIIVLTLIRQLFEQNYEGVALCAASLVLFLLPAFIEKSFRLSIPPLFEALIYIFIFASAILGEINEFYIKIPGWDTMLHTLNGFLCALMGFSTVDLLNRNSNRLKLSPVYQAMVAFCFSMTVGVCWEFIEFFMDRVFLLDMQKDTMVTVISSVTLNENLSNVPVRLHGITQTLVMYEGGTHIIEGGYLDIGLIDTIKDLFVNFIGAICMSCFGYVYLKISTHKEELPERYRKQADAMKYLADDLIVKTLTNESEEETDLRMR